MPLSNAIIGPLIEDYKNLIAETGLGDELYKWKLLKQFRGRPNLDAPDFGEEVKSINYQNLIFHTGITVSRFIAQHRPDEYREAFREFFDENTPLRMRMEEFQRRALAIYREIEPEEKFGLFHDERTLSTFLTFRDPDKYTLYKDSFYRKFCERLGIQPQKAGSKYAHYLQLVDEFVTDFIVKDAELLAMVDSCLTEDCFDDSHRKILAQDILYQSLDKKSGDMISADGHTRKYWLYAPGEGGSHWGEFYEEGVIALGWEDLGDLSQYNSQKQIADRLRQIERTDSSKANDSLANFEFQRSMEVGDVVIPKRGRRTYLGWGVVASEYIFDESRTRFKSIRRVDWKNKGEWEADFKIALKTLTDITKYPEYVDQLIKLLDIEPDPAPAFWFVCQGQTLSERQGMKYLFAPHEGSDGRPIPHWASMKRVHKGDIIFNYADKALRGVSIAKEDSWPGANPNPKDGGNNEGSVVNIDFTGFDPPIDYSETTEFAANLRRAVHSVNGPFDVNGRIKQGYLFEFNKEGAEIIRRMYGKPFPESIELSLSLQPTTTAPAIINSLNTILYGPPGTGKTYNSIDKAVEIVTGIASGDHSENKRNFDRLRSAGQIEFVTFHQNYSYEEFMVGIRPDVDNEELRFQAQKGIFYRIAKRARDNYEESKVGKGRRSFDEVLAELLEPLEKGEEVPVKMASGISFRITEVSEKSLSFTKQSGGKDHTLSISTLRDVVEGVRDVPGGLDSYYKPLVKLIQLKRETTEPAENQKNYVLIIDEINRANISRVFGELITLLEEDKRLGAENELKVTLPNGEKDFSVPPNLYLVGTMNTADKSIALIDIALRRRFDFVGYSPNYSLISVEAANLLREVNTKIYQIKKSADYLIGHAYFMNSPSIEAVLRNKVVPLVMEYLGGKTETVKQIFDGTEWNVSFNVETYDWDIEVK